ncbi:hypothetical protein OR1_03676 [Geobacter sp. OR-1]|uniref:hypothetical protein n=1 Tax=Geobacter sp. OR-1 TaxID=1266765 RepID=UPI0005433810|nr:hypothetical protein [Geobacter sp. OR-1]GAM11362.1 hypothetical protein OR1_03676 [Geobacter sp. OR-1]
MNLPDFIANNLSLKIVSLVMGSLFWLYVMAGKDAETRVQVPVVMINLDSGLTIVDKPPVALDVELRGSRLSLMTLRKDSLRLILDMAGVREGSVSFTNLDKTLISDSRIRVTRIYPAHIELSLARLAR